MRVLGDRRRIVALGFSYDLSLSVGDSHKAIVFEVLDGIIRETRARALVALDDAVFFTRRWKDGWLHVTVRKPRSSSRQGIDGMDVSQLKVESSRA